MAANGNSAQRRIAAVDEIRSGGEIVDNLARMSEAPVLLPGGPACLLRETPAGGAQERPARLACAGERHCLDGAPNSGHFPQVL